MKRIVIVIVIALLAVGVLLAVLGGKDKNNQSQVPATTQDRATDQPTEENPGNNQNANEQNIVTIKDFAFQPSTITVKKGTTVTWTNQDDAKHDVTPDQESDDFKPSELLDKGESYSFTFNKAGTYSYHCSPHPYMKATVVVVES